MRLAITLLLIISSLFDGRAQSLVIEQPVRMLALGDSYTIGQGVAVEERWPEQLMDSLESLGLETHPVDIIAMTGWTTSELQFGIDQTQPDSNYTLVSLLIGVNNQFGNGSIVTYGEEFTTLLERAIAFAGGVAEHVVVVSIPDYAFTPVGAQFSNVSEEIEEFNAVNDSITALYNVPYLYITDISQRGLDEPDLVASDRLHPSGKMYAEWVSRLIDESELVLTSSVIPQDLNKELSLFPNPTSGTVYRGKNVDEIDVYDIQGRHVLHWTADRPSIFLTGPATYVAVSERGRQVLVIR